MNIEEARKEQIKQSIRIISGTLDALYLRINELDWFELERWFKRVVKAQESLSKS